MGFRPLEALQVNRRKQHLRGGGRDTRHYVEVSIIKQHHKSHEKHHRTTENNTELWNTSEVHGKHNKIKANISSLKT
jgi:hypothetical protein